MKPPASHDSADRQESRLSLGLAQALEDKTFVKLTLGKYRGQGEPRKSVATLVLLKDLPHLKFVTSYGRKDETKNFALAEGIDHVGSMVGYPYLSATLFTTKRDTTLTYSKKGEPHLATGKADSRSRRACPARSDESLSRCSGSALSEGVAGVGRRRPRQAQHAG